MAYIQDWVTEIIIFILIAMIVDLILPQSSMQKYIRFAVGMILVLIFLQPLFHIFNTNPSQFLQSQLLPSTSNESAQLENDIENQKIEIQASQRAYILNQIAVQLKDQAEEELINQYGVTIEDITFNFPTNAEEVSWENIERVSVYLQREDEQGEKNIEEVNIDLNEEPPSDELPVEDIKHDLSSFWEITKDKITIVGEGGDNT
ncbi:stage III sporulation protein AF [Salinibacillus xinjiangensis]|uniref:Stage III sporulation protein AF n=1 Tax=Salinibacillus xinjiangensis TaxID=1229268 RepID=A0A6G1X6C9_9BACI|nr:stage III sporulation protein AF [Salinibacillus xinjiangensis]MRG86553.1 stage III sporulation protein AF [Salinibacillus xinjiangensis]